MKNYHTSFIWKLNCGNGSNTRAEQMGTWASLYMVHRLGIDDIHLLGDSKIVIGGLNKKTTLQVVPLERWKEIIEELFEHFKKLSFAHIFREDNKVADVL